MFSLQLSGTLVDVIHIIERAWQLYILQDLQNAMRGGKADIEKSVAGRHIFLELSGLFGKKCELPLME